MSDLNTESVTTIPPRPRKRRSDAGRPRIAPAGVDPEQGAALLIEAAESLRRALAESRDALALARRLVAAAARDAADQIDPPRRRGGMGK